jgi:hypothetical protein
MKISEMTTAGYLDGSEYIEIVQNGVSMKATLQMIRDAAPVSDSYPDVPLNRVVMKKYANQTSALPTIEGNLALLNNILAMCFPALLDRNSNVSAYLNGANCLKTADGSPANLTRWNYPCMTRIGGFWFQYEYEASTNIKYYKFSPYKVKGYRYIRRRYIGMFNANTVTNTEDGTSKTFLCSNYDVYTKQSISVQNAHSYAKNLGPHYRAMADQDHEIYTLLFWLLKGNFNSQAVYRGIVDVNYTNWSNYNKTADGGQSSYGQFHKNGATIGLTSHEGEVSLSVPDFPNGAITVKPNRFLWRENGLGGPYFIFMSGRLIIDNVVWQVNDLSNIAFTKTADFVQLCSLASIAPASDGPQNMLETYRDTIMPSAIGGSSTTGMCDQWYGLAAPTAGGVYVPARLGAADDASTAGLVFLASNHGPSNTRTTYGVSLASDDPTDTIADGTIAV